MSNVNLFCLPFAGGSKYSYLGYTKNAPEKINVIPVELPGRGTRFNEPLLTDIHLLVDDAFNQIKDKLNDRYAIYGHSMGTLIGYLLTKRILREEKKQPCYLFFTGCVGPSVKSNEPVRYLMPREKFIEKLKEYGGSPDEILNDEDLLGLFEPILRADFQAVETYEYKESEALDIPITVIIGLDERATYEEALAWQKETVHKVEVHQMPGKHFFIFDYQPQIMNIIGNKLELNGFLK